MNDEIEIQAVLHERSGLPGVTLRVGTQTVLIDLPTARQIAALILRFATPIKEGTA